MRKFRMHNQAVAGVIEALLLVAMVAIIISMIQLVYIPQVMEQKESEHMDQVFNQFSSLKSMVDLQAITRSSAPISSMITLGSRELPYFITAKAFGEVKTQEDAVYKIKVFPEIYNGSVPKSEFPLKSIVYEADNSYFVDQTYVLEGGGIIVTQPDGKPVMRADPSIFSENKSQLTIRFDLPVINGTRGKNDTSGEGNCFIRTNYESNRVYSGPIDSSSHIWIYTKYLNAWNESLHSLLGEYINNKILKIDNPPETNYIEIIRGPNPLFLNKVIYLQLNVINIEVQIGPGWII